MPPRKKAVKAVEEDANASADVGPTQEEVAAAESKFGGMMPDHFSPAQKTALVASVLRQHQGADDNQLVDLILSADGGAVVAAAAPPAAEEEEDVVEDTEDEKEEEGAEDEDDFEDGETPVQLTLQVCTEFEDFKNIVVTKHSRSNMDKVIDVMKAQFPYFQDVPARRLRLTSMAEGYEDKVLLVMTYVNHNMKVKLSALEEGNENDNSSSNSSSSSSSGKLKKGGQRRPVPKKPAPADDATDADGRKQSDIRDFASSAGGAQAGGGMVINLADEEPEEEIEITVYEEGVQQRKATMRLSRRYMSLDVLKTRCLDVLQLNTVEYVDLELVTGSDIVAVTDSKQLTNGAEVQLTNLRYYSFCDHKADLIGKKFFSAKNLQDFDQTTIDRFSSVFRFYRRVGGDGNCFYRAFYVGVIEKLLNAICNQEPLDDDADDANDDKWDEKLEEEARDKLSQYFSTLKSVRRMDSPDDQNNLRYIESDLLTSCTLRMDESGPSGKPSTWLFKMVKDRPDLDEVLVRAQRCIVAAYLEDAAAVEASLDDKARGEEANSEKPDGMAVDEPSSDGEAGGSGSGGGGSDCVSRLPSISIAEVIMINFDGLTVQQFVNDVVLMPGRDAEDVIVIFASRAFQARVCVWQVDPRADERLRCLAGEEVGTPPPGTVFFGEVHLLLRGGHYDLLYVDQTCEANDSASSVPAVCEMLRKPLKEINDQGHSDKQEASKRKRDPADAPGSSSSSSSSSSLSSSSSSLSSPSGALLAFVPINGLVSPGQLPERKKPKSNMSQSAPITIEDEDEQRVASSSAAGKTAPKGREQKRAQALVHDSMMSEVGDFEGKIATTIAAFSESDIAGLRGIHEALRVCMYFFDKPVTLAFAEVLDREHVTEKDLEAMKDCGILESEAVTIFVNVYDGIQADQVGGGSQDNRKRAVCVLMMNKFIDALDAALPSPM